MLNVFKKQADKNTIKPVKGKDTKDAKGANQKSAADQQEEHKFSKTEEDGIKKVFVLLVTNAPQ
jgi:hypothetical protein